MAEPISLRTRPYTGDLYRGSSEAAVAPRPRPRLGLHVALFAGAFLTAAIANAYLQGFDPTQPDQLVHGFPYAFAVMTILLFHECGHYVLARVHRVDATLPYFIPAPPIFFIGTLGAFIRMRSMPRDRRALFDIGAAGPWAGMMIAVPTLVIGLYLSDVQPQVGPLPPGDYLGDCLLFRMIARAVLGVSPDDVRVVLHPVALAGWVGCLVTALNLLPVGQLDGGHVTYAAFGERWHRWISRGTLTTLIVLGVSGALTWLVWAMLLSFIGLRHPRLADEETPLDPVRTWAAVATLVVLLLTFMPEPIYRYDPPRIPRDEHTIPVRAPAPPPYPEVIAL